MNLVFMGESMTGGKNQVEEKYILTHRYGDDGVQDRRSLIVEAGKCPVLQRNIRSRRRSRDGQRWIRARPYSFISECDRKGDRGKHRYRRRS